MGTPTSFSSSMPTHENHRMVLKSHSPRSARGHQKYQSSLQRKQADMQLRLLSNRIQHLTLQEQKAKKSIQNSLKQAQTRKKNRTRYQQDKTNQHFRRQAQKRLQQQLSEKAQADRLARKQAIKKRQQELLQQKIELNRFRRQQRHQNNLSAQQNKQQDYLTKFQSKLAKYSVKKEEQHSRALFHQHYQQELLGNYQARIDQDRRVQEQIKAKLARLSEFESSLIERVSNTLNLQAEARQKLQKAIENSSKII